MYGTEFIITKKIKERFLEFEPVSDEIHRMHIKGEFRNINIIYTYASTEEKTRDKEEFYKSLGFVYCKIQKYDILVLGDVNAKIRKEDSL